MAVFPQPGSADSTVSVKSRYDNYIGGEWVAPVKGQYFENITPVTGKPFTEIARSTAEDIDKALDAAHAAKDAWGKTSAAARSVILNQIADRIEANLQDLAIAETWENGKSVRETMAADLPLAVDHFRYFAGVIRAQEGGISEIDATTVAYHIQEPLGVVGQIIPWNFPILMAVWKLAPALAAGNCVVMKPAEQTPWSILKVVELIGDLLPAGVLNIVNGFGVEAGKPLASSPRIAKIAFTGETTTGRLIMQYASANLIPVTLELGGKSPNIFFDNVAAEKDAFYNKALEGFTMFALNQGEVCTCPSRALIQDSIYDQFLGDALERVGKIKQGNPLDTDTMIGAQASNDQLEKILSYMDIGTQEGAKILAGGHRAELEGDLAGGYYVQPTVFEGNNKMRIFQEEIFGPVVSVTRFSDEADALAIANDTLYGLGAGVWSRDGSQAYRAGRAIQAGRVWTNCYHAYP
ncbi:MAG TPA: aldehyde dehydrogenase family protein, partial [Thermoanaerobaculia bacterium]|nr:aldehyde dehydrogenase family protein [Thermoanaerobaculia bacterium]